MNSNNIFLDLDGTLIDTSERSYALYAAILRRYGKKALPKKKYLLLKREKEDIVDILKRTGAENLLKVFKKEWQAKIETPIYLKYDRLFPNTKAVLAKLSQRHALYLITIRKNRDELDRELKQFRLKNYFKKILIGKEERQRVNGKIKMLRAHAKKGDILIGDSETDIRTGKALGLTTIAVASGWRTPEFLKLEKPDYLVANAEKLPFLPIFK